MAVVLLTPPPPAARPGAAVKDRASTNQTCSARGLGLVGSLLTVRCAAPSTVARSSEVFLLLSDRGEEMAMRGAALVAEIAAAIEGAAAKDRILSTPEGVVPAPRTRAAAHEGARGRLIRLQA